MIIDTHAHLFEKVYDNDIDRIFNERKKDNLKNIIVVGYSIESSILSVNLAKKYNCYCLIGVHPAYVNDFNENSILTLKELAKNKEVVGIGEIGLDYHYADVNKQLQQVVFLRQLQLANELNLPISIHLRDAFDDILKILSINKNLIKNSGIMHCFSGDFEKAKNYLDLGFYISFGGVLTFNNAQKNVEVAKNTPLDKIVLETDCPFLSPVPFRGKRNEPKYCNLVAKKLAEIKQTELRVVEEVTLKNTLKIFKKMEILWI